MISTAMLRAICFIFFMLVSANVMIAQTQVTQTPSPALLVLEKGDGKMAIVDPTSLKVAGRVAAGTDPHEIAASSDGSFAYISNYGAFASPQHTISVVDLLAQKASPTVDLGALIAPHGIEFVEGKVYFTAEGSKVIGRYDPAAKQVDWVLGVGQNRTHMLKVSADRNRIFTSNVNSGTISIIDRDKHADASGWSETVIPVGKGDEGFDVSPDGKELWAANADDGTVSIIDVAARKVTDTLDLHIKHSNRLKFTPDGKLVLISDAGGGELVVVDSGTRKLVKRLTVGHGAAGILIVPDGSRAFIAVSPDNYVCVFDLKALSVTGRIATGKGPDGMA